MFEKITELYQETTKGLSRKNKKVSKKEREAIKKEWDNRYDIFLETIEKKLDTPNGSQHKTHLSQHKTMGEGMNEAIKRLYNNK